MGEGLQNLVLCSKPTAFEQGGIFIVPHLLWRGTLVGGSCSQDHPKLVAFHDNQRKLKTYEELWLVRLVIKHLKWWNIYLYDFWNFQLILNFFFTQNIKYVIFCIKEMKSFSHFFLICTLFNSMSACDLVSISWSDIIYNILVMDQIMTHPMLLGILLLLLLLLLSGELLMLSSVGLELRFYLFDIYISIHRWENTSEPSYKNMNCFFM